MSRRDFLKNLAASGAMLQTEALEARARSRPTPAAFQAKKRGALIDRQDLVRRHNPIIRNLDPLSPLTIGNGEFAFTSDVTGLQTFPEEYDRATPLCTMSQWGWHTTPLPAELRTQQLRLTMFEAHGRKVGYAVDSEGQAELYKWLRENPHRLHLGRIGLKLMRPDGGPARADDIADVEQRLDLWTGVLRSRFRVQGRLASVTTAVHPAIDLVAVSIESELIAEGLLAVRFAFPYGSPAMQAADWSQPARHRSEAKHLGPTRVEVRRTLDNDEYFVAIAWEGDASFSAEGEHRLLLTPGARQPSLKFVTAFSRTSISKPPHTDEAFAETTKHWKRFWRSGAAIELADSGDRRAPELERRVVLSQYLTAVQCAGSKPPQETGLTVNSWYGKFHLEMHWWHAAHFALWNRTHLLEKSLSWYREVLQRARELAASQGYAGARWPKMTGPEGRDSPSPIGPLLIWQQPHPIAYAELCYRQHRDRATLARYSSVVFESAEFMASFAVWDDQTRRYVLGPPVIPAQENHPPRETWNPTFELAYWAYGLRTAQRWRERLGLRRSAQWDAVIDKLSPLPERDGVYLAHENCPQTFTGRNYDHPSMLGAYGMLSGDGVNPRVMRETLKRVLRSWQWERTWGWDYPLAAMTAARLGEPELAVNALMMETERNRYLPNGHNWQRSDLPCYLPGNGGLLYAAALMAAGWRSAPRGQAPGFPSGGSWVVRCEGFNRAPLSTL
jgi:hypothetical protein